MQFNEASSPRRQVKLVGFVQDSRPQAVQVAQHGLIIWLRCTVEVKDNPGQEKEQMVHGPAAADLFGIPCYC